jgi:lysophospholipase L1-like esterase
MLLSNQVRRKGYEKNINIKHPTGGGTSKFLKLITPVFALALLLGGGFLISQNQTETALALADWSSQPAYAQTFADDFHRANTAAVGLDNNYVQLNKNALRPTTYAVADNKLSITTPDGAWSGNALLRPAEENIRNGSIEVVADFSSVTDCASGVMLYGRYNATSNEYTGDYYIVWLLADGRIFIRRTVNGPLPGGGAGDKMLVQDTDTTNSFCGKKVRIAFSVDSVSAAQSALKLDIYDVTYAKGNALLKSLNTTNDDAALQTSGQWGFMIYGGAPSKISVNRVAISERTDISATSVQYGDNSAVTLLSDTNRTVNLSDNGAGGSFSVSNVDLVAGVESTVTYTPAQSGNVVISAGALGSTEIVVSPYSTKIGYIGDSLTVGATSQPMGYNNAVEQEIALLGPGFSAVNMAVNGSSASGWVAGSSNMTAAIAAFQANDVEVVSVMLGTNSAPDAATYKTQMTAVIAALKDAGIKKIILNTPASWHHGNPGAENTMASYTAVIAELASDGFVRQGDAGNLDFADNGLGWTYANPDQVDSSAVHLTDEGYEVLGGFWADSYSRVITDEIYPNHEWLTGADSFVLETTGTLTHSIDKYFGEFSGVVRVDGVVLASADYVITTATDVRLSNAFLNSLTVGNHDLTVEFDGGVFVNAKFMIVAAETKPSEPTTPANPTTPIIPAAPNTGVGR